MSGRAASWPPVCVLRVWDRGFRRDGRADTGQPGCRGSCGPRSTGARSGLPSCRGLQGPAGTFTRLSGSAPGPDQTSGLVSPHPGLLTRPGGWARPDLPGPSGPAGACLGQLGQSGPEKLRPSRSAPLPDPVRLLPCPVWLGRSGWSLLWLWTAGLAQKSVVRSGTSVSPPASPWAGPSLRATRGADASRQRHVQHVGHPHRIWLAPWGHAGRALRPVCRAHCRDRSMDQGV